MRLCLLILFTTSFSMAQTDLVFPWVTNNSLFRSQMIINNLNPVAADITLHAIRASGETEAGAVTVPALGQIVLNTSEQFPELGEGLGYAVRMQSNADLIKAGFIVSSTASTSGNSPAQADVMDPALAANVLLYAYMPAQGDIFSAPVLVNTGTTAATITFYAYQDGLRYQTLPITIPGNFTPYAALVSDLFPQLSGNLFLVAESDQPIFGTAFIFNNFREPSMAAALPLSTVPNHQQHADMVFTNGVVYTNSSADAVAVIDGKIAFIGSTAEVQTWIDEDTQVFDLAGKMLSPGFIDNHNHLGEGGEVFCFPDRDQTLESQADLLAQCAAGVEQGQWIIGYGGAFELEIGEDEIEGRPLEILDAVFPNHPVIIMDYTSHSMFVNSLAYAAVNITNTTPNPQGGRIMKDETGQLNGILLDNAGDLVMEEAVNNTPNKFDVFYDGITFGLQTAAANGITTVGDGRTYWRRGMYETWKEVEADGGLTARISLRPWIYPELGKPEQLAFLGEAFQNDIHKLLVVNQVKMYSDGVPEYGTGRVIEPYQFTYFPDMPHGLNYIPFNAMTSWFADLQTLGYGAHVHAIGDLGVRETLDAVEAARKAGSTLKYNMTHLYIMDPADVTRFAALDVDADLQIASASHTHEERAGGLEFFIGEARAQEVLFTPVKELTQAGANVVLSSDWTVNPINPMNAISFTVEEGSLTINQAIDAYTINAAKALGFESITGSIEVGKSADFAVLDRNLLQSTPAQIRAAKVVLTVLQGKVVYQ